MIEDRVLLARLGVDEQELRLVVRQVNAIPEPSVVGQPMGLDARVKHFAAGQVGEARRTLVVGLCTLTEKGLGQERDGEQAE